MENTVTPGKQTVGTITQLTTPTTQPPQNGENLPVSEAKTNSSVVNFSIDPKNFNELSRFASMVANSDFAPKDYQKKPANVMIAIQMGAEVGLKPMQSLQSIAVINGRPSIFGDLGKALLLNSPQIEHVSMSNTEEVRKTGIAWCEIQRKGYPLCRRTFSIEDAKQANLWGKQGPWSNYPQRQMTWRAFWFAARDIAADILKGLEGAEEVSDFESAKTYQEFEPKTISGETYEEPKMERSPPSAFQSKNVLLNDKEPPNFSDPEEPWADPLAKVSGKSVSLIMDAVKSNGQITKKELDEYLKKELKAARVLDIQEGDVEKVLAFIQNHKPAAREEPGCDG